jgi:predicted permease
LLVAILMILVLLVLLIACANVGNLLLAIAVGRRHEATMKLALGASRGRIVREFLAESIVICVVSSVLGYALAEVAILRYSTIAVEIPMMGPYSVGIKLDLGLTVAAAMVALMFVAILAAGLPAALYASSPNLSQILSGEMVVGGTRKAIRRSALVIVQIAVCTLVLVGMGLCQRSLYNLRHVDKGFSSRNLLTESLYPSDANYTEAQGKALYSNVSQLVSSVPGVQSVALASDLPLFGNDGRTPVLLQARNPAASAMSTTVDGNYFSTLGIALIAGRAFNASDTSRDTDSVIVNHQLAQTLWPGQDAVGRALLTGDPPRKAVVVGVAGDSKYDDLSEDPQPFVYYAASQHYLPQMNIIAKTAGDPYQWIQPLTRTVTGTGFTAVLRPISMDEVENVSLLPERIIAGCVAGLSALGLLLAIVGLFGAISYSVSERKKELGIRVALGAGRWHLLRMIFRQTLVVAGAGTVVGVLLGIGVTVLLRSQFFGIRMVEWSVLIPVAAAMLGISLAVAYFSARRWIRVDPMEAVRHG